MANIANLSNAEGEYELIVAANNIEDLDGNNGVGGKGFTWELDNNVPTLTGIDEITEPRNIANPSITVTFDQAIAPESFNFQDITLTVDGGESLITENIEIEEQDETTYVIKGLIPLQTENGEYTLTVNGSGITDSAGNSIPDNLSTSWELDTIAPLAATNILVNDSNNSDPSDSTQDKIDYGEFSITSNNITIAGELPEENLQVYFEDITTGDSLGQATVTGTSFTGDIELSGVGYRTVEIALVDVAGNSTTGTLELFADVTLPTIGLNLDKETIEENTAPNSVIGQFSTTNPDNGDTFTYELVAGEGDTDNQAFTIDGNQLKIKGSPDFETKSNYNIRVKTTDEEGESLEQQLTINVNDINEAPTALTLNNTTINENESANSIVGRFSTTDPDNGDSFTYALVAGDGDTNNQAFTIEGEQLRIKSSPDFETKSNYNIRVKTTDGEGESLEKQLTINVNDINEAPTALNLSNTAINENVAPNSVIGQFATTDSENGKTFTYELVAGEGDIDNQGFTIDGKQLKIKGSPDFETKSNYNIRVKTTDAGGASLEKQLTINVNDINEAPTGLNLDKETIYENAAPNSIVGEFTTTDPDNGDTFTYKLVSGTLNNDNQAFTIDECAAY